MHRCLGRLVLIAALLTALCFFTSGCADDPQAMTAALTPSATIPATVQIKVTGTKGSNPDALTYLTDDEIATAVKLSLEERNLFDGVRTDGSGNYQIEIVVTTIEPAMGFTDTVQIHASWMLIKQSNDTVVWKQTVDSSCTKTGADAFAGGTRVVMAEEGAVQENIRIALQSLQNAHLGT